MAISNVFTEPGVYSQFLPSTVLPVLPGGVRVAALLGTGRTTNLVKGEQVTKGSVDAQDSLSHTATSLAPTITDQNFLSYALGVDYQLTSGKVDWSLNGAAFLVGTNAQTYNGLVGKSVILSVDNGVTQSYTFVLSDFANATAATASEVGIALQANISNIICSVDANRVKISTISVNNGSLYVSNGTANSILGFTAGSVVYTPKEPAPGVAYFVDYEYDKVAADYTPKFYFNMDSIVADYGAVDPANSLSLGSEIVFQQGASVVCLVQLNPADGAVYQQLNLALAKLLSVEGVNEVVPLVTDPTTFSLVKAHVDQASSILERKERVAIVGLAGSPSLQAVVSQAQALADKRMVLVYPTVCTRFVGTNPNPVSLDGSFIAAAIAGIRTSTSFDVAEPLTRKEVAGFVDIPNTLLRSEKNVLSSSGVMVIETVSSISRVRFQTTTDPSTVDRRELSVVEIIDYVSTSMRTLLEAIFIGQKILADTPSQVRSTISAVLQDFVRNDIIVSFTDITASVDTFDPTQIDVSFKIAPVFPLNYILIQFSLSV